MTYDLLVALVSFAFVTTITPGPNNLMLMASGANFGFWRTIPHMLGVGLGFTFMVALVGVGLMQVFDAYPVSHTLLRILSVAYLFYLAWKIANAGAPEAHESAGKPITFLQAAAFQWVNPKAWAMALAAISAYAPDRTPASIAWVTIVFALVNLPTVTTWTVVGQQIRHLLGSPRSLRLFNWSMAALLVSSLIWLLVS
ncbi:MAG: LysE family translocator [Pseudomonadota bacterium]